MCREQAGPDLPVPRRLPSWQARPRPYYSAPSSPSRNNSKSNCRNNNNNNSNSNNSNNSNNSTTTITTIIIRLNRPNSSLTGLRRSTCKGYEATLGCRRSQL
jgi:hypothetical protein